MLSYWAPDNLCGGWRAPTNDYSRLIRDPTRDSAYLRDSGLVPTIVELAGDTEGLCVLDVGTMTGWLFDRIEPAHAYACDVRPLTKLPHKVKFAMADATWLPYRDKCFDLIVASMVLIWCPDLGAAISELARIATPSGRLIVAIMHPYFYATGKVTTKGDFLLSADLSTTFSKEVRIGEEAGPFTYYYYPLDRYFKELIAAGWSVEVYREWFIDESDLKSRAVESPRKRTGRVPFYCFFRCKRSIPANS